jgi:hypothetical protein
MKMYLNNMRDVVKALTVFFRKERNWNSDLTLQLQNPEKSVLT